MGRLIIVCKGKYNTQKLESIKCKSGERAKEIVDKRRDVVSYQYYDKNEKILTPSLSKKTNNRRLSEQNLSLEDMDSDLKTI